MSKRRSSGLFETMVKSAFGFGSTVQYKESFWGKPQKIVTYHDSGKTKTYSHGHGIFGDVTKTTTRTDGRVIESGTVRKNLLYGATEHARRMDGTEVRRAYVPGIFTSHVHTKIQGECWKCEGTGIYTGICRTCEGTGLFHIDAKPCFACNGTGLVAGVQCRKCTGTGQHMAATEVACRKCGGEGTFTATCKKCDGSGIYEREHFN
jgi:hypothetical protein